MKFNDLSHDEKLEVQKSVNDCIDKMGGRNHFLAMIESVKESKQHPLSNKTSKFHFKGGTVQWGKEIYKDKVEALKSMLITHQKDNILSVENPRLNKEIKNTVKTLGKLTFTISVENEEVFTFKPFDTRTENNIELNCFFQIIFFDSINNTKRILSYS